MRPIEYFLSHQKADRDDVVDLEGAMRRRGLASWRDRKNLAVGDGTDVMIEAAIERETNGFVIYGSDNIIGSDYVWNKEWPWAHARHEGEVKAGHSAPYRLIPLLVGGLDYRTVSQAATKRARPDPTVFNGEKIDRGDQVSRDLVARYLLHAALADRAKVHAGPLKIRLTTFPGKTDVDADALVDWSPELSVTSTDWPPILAARDDLKNEIAVLGRPIEVDAQARLDVAFVFGRAFPLTSRIPIVAVHRDGQRWSMRADTDISLVTVDIEPIDDGDPSIAAVEVSLGRDVAVTASAATDLGLHPAKIARIGFGSGREVVDGDVAAAAAFTFGRVLRTFGDAGVDEVHLFMAVPAALAVLLGASINAGPSLTVYHRVDGRYVGTSVG